MHEISPSLIALNITLVQRKYISGSGFFPKEKGDNLRSSRLSYKLPIQTLGILVNLKIAMSKIAMSELGML